MKTPTMHQTSMPTTTTTTPRGARRVRRGARLLTATVGLAALLLSSCATTSEDEGVASAGGPASSSTASAGADDSLTPQQKGQRYVDCLRAEGVEASDADAEGGMSLGSETQTDGGIGFEVDDVLMDAVETCADLAYVPESHQGRDEGEDAEFVTCMREKGIELQGVDGATEGLMSPPDDADAADVSAAAEECR